MTDKPNWREVLEKHISKSILKKLTDEEIAAVIDHEMIHDLFRSRFEKRKVN